MASSRERVHDVGAVQTDRARPSFTPRLRPRRNTAFSTRLPTLRAAGISTRLPSTYREATITSAASRRAQNRQEAHRPSEIGIDGDHIRPRARPSPERSASKAARIGGEAIISLETPAHPLRAATGSGKPPDRSVRLSRAATMESCSSSSAKTTRHYTRSVRRSDAPANDRRRVRADTRQRSSSETHHPFRAVDDQLVEGNDQQNQRYNGQRGGDDEHDDLGTSQSGEAIRSL